jgi:cytochrome c peroxidase
VAYARSLFHDGRAATLEEQIWGPLLSPIEMANDSPEALTRKLRTLEDYDGLFEAAFAGARADKDTIAGALASYERALLAADSPFDRWRFGGDETALSDAARRGFALFSGEAGCAQCHSVADDHALFTDDQFHDTGIGYLQSGRRTPATTRVRLAAGVYAEVDREIVDEVSEPPVTDDGRAEATGDPNDRWKYRTPTLRNVALTAPYMHDGSIATLAAVVDYYADGAAPHDGLDPRLRRLDLDAGARADLVAFLESLTGATVATLIVDAAAAPIGDP